MSNRSNRGRNIATAILAVLAIAILGVMAFLVGRAGLTSMKTETAASEEQTVSFENIITDSTESPAESAASAVESAASAAESAEAAAEKDTKKDKKKKKKKAAESKAESAAESASESAEPAVEYPLTAYGAGYDINVRAAANTEGEVLGTIQRGEAVTVTAVTEDGWSTVDYNGQTGYIKSEFLSTDKTYDQVWDLETLPNDRLDFGYSSENRDGDNVPTDWRWYEAKWGQFNVDWIQDTSQKTIYLTMDEGFGNDNTIKILDTLKEKNVNVTFFLTKSFVDERPELVQRMLDEGHQLGNHTCTHRVMPELSIDEQTEEIMTLQNQVKEQFGYDMKLFRYPEGAYSEQSLGLVNNLGFKAVFWSYAYVDYNDEQPPVDESLQAALDALHPGAVYLLHAKSDTNTAMLADFIDGARDKGFEFGTYPLSAN